MSTSSQHPTTPARPAAGEDRAGRSPVQIVAMVYGVVFLLVGIAGLALARTGTMARHYLLWGGVIYLVLWLYGLFIGHDSPGNFVPLNDADNWLHLGLGVTMVALSFLPRFSSDRPDRMESR